MTILQNNHKPFPAMLTTILAALLLNSSIEVHNPRIPLILDQEYNVVSEIMIPCKETGQVKGEVEVTFDGIPLKAVKKVSLVSTGTVSPLVSKSTSQVVRNHVRDWSGGADEWRNPRYSIEYCSVRPEGKGAMGTVRLPFDRTLVKGENYLYVSLEVASKKVDLSGTFSCKVNSVTLDSGKADLEVSGPSEGRRFGICLRTHLDNGSDTYRIPGLARTPKGTLIAVYDIRWGSYSDLQADIDVGVSRSKDGGRKWEKMRVAIDMGEYGGLPESQNGAGDPCVLVDEKSGKIFIAAIWAHGLKGQASIFTSRDGLDPIDVAQMVLVSSEDDGKTWSKPESITPQIKDPSWATAFEGPGCGITMEDGTLVFPFQYWDRDKIPYSGIIFSKDGGLTWHFNKAATDHVCECQAVELEKGELMLNMRNHASQDRFRKVFTTKDLGASWSKHSSDSTLQEPICQASLFKSKASENCLGKDILLFSNPDSKTARNHMTIKASEDLGKTWPFALMLDEEGGWGYSCLAMIDPETVGIAYEGSTAQITFQAVKLKDILKQTFTVPAS